MSTLSQDNRFEYKYLIQEPDARAVRDWVQQHLDRDRFADPRRNNSYPVHSLYLDNAGLDLCRATLDGHKNRFKLRVRFYDECPEHPVFFEVKRRVSDVILKQRAAVRRASALPLLAGHAPALGDLADRTDDAMAALVHFCHLRRAAEADGRAFVSYLREAYASPDERVRVTFDRQVRGALYRHVFALPEPRQWTQAPVDAVVLELKFTERFPAWMGDMVRALDLWRSRMAKYVTCTSPGPTLENILQYEF